ncbi:MAG: hypothetical protein ACR2JJ_08540 [Sphingomicrobium sp.]
MSARDSKEPQKPKRTDVGYKRPPFETRYKKGQKRPPRKKKVTAHLSARDLFWKVLQERRRVVIDGKPVWLSNADLIARRSFLEAEKGSPVLSRLLNQLLLKADAPAEDEKPEIILDPDYQGDGPHVGVATIRVEPPAGDGSHH